MADWYYIGHYGQLGPLTREQLDELIEGGVIQRDTFVWKTGMTDWVPAGQAKELQPSFGSSDLFVSPPPPPVAPRPFAAAAPPRSMEPDLLLRTDPYFPVFGSIKSDKSRTAGGILQIIIPGVGRMYLGYSAIGVLQLLLSFCAGVGWLWSVIDGIIILAGGVKMDGYGRYLTD